MTQTKRVALIIGNSNYEDGKKVSGIENAKAIDAALKDLGFDDVDRELLTDATLHDMTQALDRFKARLNGAAAAVFYYSGHGFHILDKNYLLPKDGDVSATRALAVSKVLAKMDAEPNGVKLVILDACREKPDLSTTFAEPEAAPAGVYQAFSASPGQLAQSGKEDELSLYTQTLLQHIREPGLKLPELFDRVRDGVRTVSTGQYPIEAGALPQDFYFRPPVEVHLKTFGWPHRRLLVFRNGELVLPKEDQAHSPEEPFEENIPLRARGNELVLMVSHGKEYHNGQVWGRTQSWSYKLDLRVPVKDVPEGRTITLEGREDVPFKDGPHHGQTFIVAKAILFVDPVTADVTLPKLDNGFPNPDTDTAHRTLPFWAQDQEILFQEKLVNLPLSATELLGGSLNFGLTPLLIPFLDEFLKTGKVLDAVVVDPDKSYVAVRGNKALREVVQHCMTAEWPDRVRDLRASFTAFFNRHPRPFDVFADGLNESIRARAASVGFPIDPKELKVWTSLDDLSPEALANEAQPARLAAADAPEALPEAALQALAGSILQPQPGEALIDSRIVEQTVQGVTLKAQVFTFLSVKPVGAQIQLRARVIADLSDLQNRIGALIDTIPLPTDNCARFSADNLVARIWGKQLTVDGNTATLKLSGNVEVWGCLELPFGLPPAKNRNLRQSFDAKLPVRVERVDGQSFAIKPGEPDIDFGGSLGEFAERILRFLGLDVNKKAKEILDRAIHPDLLKQKLPDFVLKYNPTLTQAELLGHEGDLTLRLEADAMLNVWQLAELIRDLISRR